MSDTPRTDAFSYECLDGDLNGVMVVSVVVAQQLERELAEVTKQRDKITSACRMLLESPEVQDSWPINGNKRAENPSETFSSAETKVKFRHLLRIHAALATAKGGDA